MDLIALRLEDGLAAFGAGQNLGETALCPVRDEAVREFLLNDIRVKEGGEFVAGGARFDRRKR